MLTKYTDPVRLAEAISTAKFARASSVNASLSDDGEQVAFVVTAPDGSHRILEAPAGVAEVAISVALSLYERLTQLAEASAEDALVAALGANEN